MDTLEILKWVKDNYDDETSPIEMAEMVEKQFELFDCGKATYHSIMRVVEDYMQFLIERSIDGKKN